MATKSLQCDQGAEKFSCQRKVSHSGKSVLPKLICLQCKDDPSPSPHFSFDNPLFIIIFLISICYPLRQRLLKFKYPAYFYHRRICKNNRKQFNGFFGACGPLSHHFHNEIHLTASMLPQLTVHTNEE